MKAEQETQHIACDVLGPFKKCHGVILSCCKILPVVSMFHSP